MRSVGPIIDGMPCVVGGAHWVAQVEHSDLVHDHAGGGDG